MGIQLLCKGTLLVVVFLSQGQAQKATTEPTKPAAVRPPPTPPPLPTLPVQPDNSTSSSEEDLSVHPGWWFPPVQFEHVLLEPNDSDEVTNTDGMIIGSGISFIPLIITKDPPGTVYYYSYNSTDNGTDTTNSTSYIGVEEAYMEVSNNGTVVEDDYIIVFPADDITGEILSPVMFDNVDNQTMLSTTGAPIETDTSTFNTTQ